MSRNGQSLVPGQRRIPRQPNGGSVVLPAAIGDTAMVFGAGVMSAGLWFDTHEHPQHQIAWAARGVIAVEIGNGYWVLPPTRALWIPGGTRHRTGTTRGATMRGIFVAPDRCPVSLTTPTMLRVSPLLRELFDHLTGPDTALARATDADRLEPVDEPPISVRPLTDARAGPAAGQTRNPADAIAAARRERAEAVVFDLLEPVDVIPVGARRPMDTRAGQVADALTRNPADPRTLAEFAVDAATSPRTLARLFLAETGISFGQWRTQIRLAASLPLLAEGLPIARIAGRIGYATPSAYVAAFRRTVGVSPGRYFAG
ncbi:helix-turn-helix transcriptional regulator [Nocardia sp. NPDC052112]|uniref:AraC family transcriptional regulator n=1 Tax=Nocardia sp. NPDC052112 TaxID=3155646 RepID=UPI0034292B24